MSELHNERYITLFSDIITSLPFYCYQQFRSMSVAENFSIRPSTGCRKCTTITQHFANNRKARVTYGLRRQAKNIRISRKFYVNQREIRHISIARNTNGHLGNSTLICTLTFLLVAKMITTKRTPSRDGQV